MFQLRRGCMDFLNFILHGHKLAWIFYYALHALIVHIWKFQGMYNFIAHFQGVAALSAEINNSTDIFQLQGYTVKWRHWFHPALRLLNRKKPTTNPKPTQWSVLSSFECRITAPKNIYTKYLEQLLYLLPVYSSIPQWHTPWRKDVSNILQYVLLCSEGATIVSLRREMSNHRNKWAFWHAAHLTAK